MGNTFEHLGYFIEFIVDGEYMGSIRIVSPDREEIGYAGQQKHVSEDTIELDNGERIGNNTVYLTRLYPLCGKMKYPVHKQMETVH